MSDGGRFGKLRWVAATSEHGWTHEGHDFTPWLAENLDLLASELEMSLLLKEREHKVGKYWLDLLLEDSGGRVVIVENQFGSTDHDHLGKLLTYCAGTEADVLIWIAENLNEEHAAALEWLNENTVEGVGFFGVELQLLTIDDSKAAPHFKVVVQPNEWVKQVRPTGPKVQSVDWDWEKFVELGISQERLAIGRALVSAIETHVEAQGLDWTPRFGKGFVSFKRPGGYNVLMVDMFWNYPVRFSVKLPLPSEELSLENPYPNLQTTWLKHEREWGWTIPDASSIPDLTIAISLTEGYQPESGPMKQDW